jgi:hypothetical protein
MIGEITKMRCLGAETFEALPGNTPPNLPYCIAMTYLMILLLFVKRYGLQECFGHKEKQIARHGQKKM